MTALSSRLSERKARSHRQLPTVVLVIVATAIAAVMIALINPASAQEVPSRTPEGPTLEAAPEMGVLAAGNLVTEDLTQGMTPDQLAQSLVGQGVTISNVTYTGANVAAGKFSGGEGIIGFENGVILSSGSVANVVGPNSVESKTSRNLLPGDPQLDTLAGYPTNDAAVLEFDFVVPDNAEKVYFSYVFASEEYNEYVGTQYNDVFGFYLNEVNGATVGDPPVPVSVNTINLNNHPELYINNDLASGAQLNTEMDGLTKVLTFEAPVVGGETNHMKLAIADAGDYSWDANVFLKAGSFSIKPPTYDFQGFFRPVDNPEVVNAVKAGSAIPVKFSLGGDQGLDIFAAGYPASQQIPNPGTEIDAIEQTVTAGNSSLSYDQLTDQYTYVWKTEKSWAGQYRELIVKLDDGTVHKALFQFK